MTRRPSTIIALLTVVLAAGAVLAQTTPLIPYQGRLEQSGRPSTGLHDFRFALFADPAAAADCLVTVTQPTDTCGVWWSEMDSVTVNAGAFSVLLGQAPPLDNAVLAQQQLWLGMAVRLHNASAFTLLAGKQRIADVPRSAAAGDFHVAGNLVVDGPVTARGDILNTEASGQLGASNRFVFRDTGDTWLRLNNAPASDVYADLAVGRLWVGTSIQVPDGAISGAALAATALSGFDTESAVADSYGTASRDLGTATRRICFLSRATGEGAGQLRTRLQARHRLRQLEVDGDRGDLRRGHGTRLVHRPMRRLVTTGPGSPVALGLVFFSKTGSGRSACTGGERDVPSWRRSAAGLIGTGRRRTR